MTWILQLQTLFKRRNNTYNLRSFQEFPKKRKRTVKMGLETLNYRSPQLWSSLLGLFCKKGVLRNFAKFTGKHLYQNLFFNKVAGLRLIDFEEIFVLIQVKTMCGEQITTLLQKYFKRLLTSCKVINAFWLYEIVQVRLF